MWVALSMHSCVDRYQAVVAQDNDGVPKVCLSPEAIKLESEHELGPLNS